jgi:hypothetical protein
MTLADCVFVFCAIVSYLCAVLLFHVYRRSKARLLMWCGLCFLGFACTNALIFADLNLSANLSVARTIPALTGICCLLYGLIMDGPS